MRKLDLDYQRFSSRISWAAWVLLLAGVALSCDVALSYFKVRKELDRPESAAGHGAAQQANSGRIYSPAELASARETIEKIAVPWSSLFHALAAAETDQVALLAIEPDSGAGILSLSGEAGDFDALLAYVSRLEQARGFHDVYLKRHEIRQDDPNHVITFLIVAHWSGKHE